MTWGSDQSMPSSYKLIQLVHHVFLSHTHPVTIGKFSNVKHCLCLLQVCTRYSIAWIFFQVLFNLISPFPQPDTTLHISLCIGTLPCRS